MSLNLLDRSVRGGARQQNPLDRSYNVFVRHMAQRLFPTGYDVEPEEQKAPTSLEDLHKCIVKDRRMVVWSGACENTIFDCPETNMDFRAWHDWCHWKGSFPFTLDGERQAVEMQCQHIDMFATGEQRERFKRYVRTDIIGTFSYRDIMGNYPENQRAWTEHLLAGLETVK